MPPLGFDQVSFDKCETWKKLMSSYVGDCFGDHQPIEISIGRRTASGLPEAHQRIMRVLEARDGKTLLPVMQGLWNAKVCFG